MYNEQLIIQYFENLHRRKINFIERELRVSPVQDKAIAIIGPRRAGKTYFLLNQFYKDPLHTIYTDFESIEFSGVNPLEYMEIISLYSARYGNIRRALLDEVQNVPDWEKLVRSLLNMGISVMVSGSSSKLLSSEVATQLRGRTLTYMLFPFSFKEFLRARNFTYKKPLSATEKEKIKVLLEEYLKFGGFPEVILNQNERERILREYFDTIFYKDFVERHSIKSLETARLIFEYLFQNYSKEIGIEKIKRFLSDRLGVHTKTTIYNYIEKLQDTFAVFFLDKFSLSAYRRREWPKKSYICDTGLASLMDFTSNFGKKMENVVFLELMRMTNTNPLLSFYYWKDERQREVDFVVKEKGLIKHLIQVTYATAEEEINPREIDALLKAGERTGCDNLLIITWDLEGEKEKSGKHITFVPMWKWLI